MGELDEAIREHLELKRRRGADPAEVAREEQEALDPVTRGHAVVAPEALEPEAEQEIAGVANAEELPPRDHGGELNTETVNDAPGDATQEFRIGTDPDDWLAEDDV
jgi:hypothetical protein